MRSSQALLLLVLLLLIGGCRAPAPGTTESTRGAIPDAADPGAGAGPRQREIRGLLEEADRALAELRLTTPADDNALDRYLRVLALAPGHPEARAGLDRIVEAYLDLALRATTRGDAERGPATTSISRSSRAGIRISATHAEPVNVPSPHRCIASSWKRTPWPGAIRSWRRDWPASAAPPSARSCWCSSGPPGTSGDAGSTSR
ncbi:MAG: hypothetical protein U5R48_16550 [Gammaproteobacteria bacterium]|nr:hypothetical protein [Gammaproteobacteria bacterium]